MNKLKISIIAAFALIILTGCKTKVVTQYEYIYPTLPEFTIKAPVNPILENIPDDATWEDAFRITASNLALVIGVNNQHTLYEETFLNFYNQIRQSISEEILED